MEALPSAKMLGAGFEDVLPDSRLVSQIEKSKRIAVTGMDQRDYSTIAEQTYKSIRELGLSDVPIIASNTGLSIEAVRIIKKHLFFGKHERFLPELGQVARKRFDANIEIAEAWSFALQQPLNAKQQEWFLLLSNHELGERQLMIQGLPFQDLSAWHLIEGEWEHVFRSGLIGAHELAPRGPKFWPF